MLLRAGAPLRVPRFGPQSAPDESTDPGEARWPVDKSRMPEVLIGNSKEGIHILDAGTTGHYLLTEKQASERLNCSVA